MTRTAFTKGQIVYSVQQVGFTHPVIAYKAIDALAKLHLNFF
jgi:hypothetical protein